jgi:hypothetical protein
MRKLPVPWTGTALPRLLCQLFQVMLGMGAVKLAPFFGAERAKDRMIEQFDAAAEPPLSIGEGGIHGDECIVESPQGIALEPVLWNGLLRSATS